jgi:cytochrome c
MVQFGMKARLGGLMVCVAVSALALSACSKKDASADTSAQPAAAPASADTTSTETASTDSNAAAPAAAAPQAPAADNTDTITGVKLASYTGDADKGKADFVTCQTCHSIAAGENKIGPSLHGVVGRAAGSIAGFTYSNANKTSGITWTPEKLFQYLENPQRVVPGTKMTFAGFSDPQKRADVIAYLKTNS